MVPLVVLTKIATVEMEVEEEVDIEAEIATIMVVIVSAVAEDTTDREQSGARCGGDCNRNSRDRISTVETASKAADTINETREPCKGNIIRAPNANLNSCNLDVTLSYSVCNYHLHTFGAEYNLLFDGASSSAEVTTSQGLEDINVSFTKLSTRTIYRSCEFISTEISTMIVLGL